MTRSVSSRGQGSAATAFYLDPNLEKSFVVVRTMPRPSARLIPYGRLQGPEQPVFLRQSRWLRQLTAAAAALGMHTSKLSRRVGALQKELVVRLLNRARASGGGDVPRQPGRERGADVEHPRWPEMWQSLIRHVRGLRFPASDHRLDETITAAQRVKYNAAKCTKTRRICECQTPARDALAAFDPGCGRGSVRLCRTERLPRAWGTRRW